MEENQTSSVYPLPIFFFSARADEGRDGAEEAKESERMPNRESEGKFEDRQRSEQTLVGLRRAVDASGEVVIMTNPEGTITFINPEFTRLYGYAESEVVGKATPRVLKSGTMATEAYATFWKTILQKRVLKTELINKTKDGRLVNIETTVNPILDERQNIIGFVAIQRDITERKRANEALRLSEERFRKAFETAPEPMTISTAAEGRYLDVNERFLKITGYSREEVIGRTSKDINFWIVPSNREDFVQTLRKGRLEDMEISYRTKSGKAREALLSAETIELNGQECLFAVTKDVTDRKELEQQLRQAQKMEAVGLLAGGVAHDFNNLLTIINGYSQVMLDRLKKDDPMRRHVTQIKKAGDRAASLTRQLLAFSRRQILAPQVLNLNAVIENLQMMLQRLLGEDVEFAAVLAKDLGRVKADPGQLEQIVLNLAVNARDAMPHGGKLTIETSNVDLDQHYASEHPTVVPGPHVMLAVSDTGLGIDAETQKHIFEPFFTTKGPGKGTGLGLSTVYGIVKQSGGSIWVYSELGHGATFKVYFPLVDEPVEALAPAKSLVESLSGNETVLLVEDEASVRLLVRETLEARGYQVLEALNGVDALLISDEEKDRSIHVLLTDVVMPDISGREIAVRLTKQRQEIKVLFMSGYTDDVVVRHGVLDASAKFIQKPFSPDALLHKIREVLGGGPTPQAS